MKTHINRTLLIAVLYLIGHCVILAQVPYPGCPNVSSRPVNTGLPFVNDTVTLPCSDNCVDLQANFLNTGQTTSYGVSSIPYAPPFPFTGGTPIFTNQDDIFSGIINLPFNFCFYGQTYNRVVVGANGLISFNTGRANGDCCYFCQNPLPRNQDANCNLGISGNGNMYWNSINGAFHDLDPSVGGTISYSIIGSAPCRTFVVSFNNVPHYSCNNLTTTQQIVLYETTNVIEIYIRQKPSCPGWEDGNACVGIQNNNGTQGIAPPGRNTSAWTANNEAWRFTPNGPANFVITWKDPSGAVIGNNPTVNVCPPSFPAKYSVQIEYTNCDGQRIIESDTTVVNQLKVTGTVSPDTTICAGDTANLR
ncbi:MAG TPA: hypothetical protein VFV37_00195, partial [Luteibaculaceae bacterium]|nr:hypothetical protein [Luteibaculaceae bacterium]